MMDRLTDIRDEGLASIRYLADKIGVSDRTMRRWLAGEDHPHPDYYARIRAVIQSF